MNKEPLLHSHITDGLPVDHPLAHKQVHCDRCKKLVHCEINECMQTWLETEAGNFCARCMPLDEALLGPRPSLNDGFKFEQTDRLEAHRAVERWLDECERAAGDQWSDGRSGYIGRVKLCSFVDDNGLSIRIERSISEAL